ncbi:hypothetical protein DIPPA_16556 [Diplonema papillatum]|nr:hypothetical protein DIPPA_16556 [Diplonema papillatum]
MLSSRPLIAAAAAACVMLASPAHGAPWSPSPFKWPPVIPPTTTGGGGSTSPPPLRTPVPTPPPHPEPWLTLPPLPPFPSAPPLPPPLSPESGSDSGSGDEPAPNVTLAPPTAKPAPGVAEDAQEAVETTTEVLAVVSAGASAGGAAQLTLIADSLCAKKSALPLIFYPAQVFGFGAIRRNIYLGAAIGNTATCLVVGILHFAAATVISLVPAINRPNNAPLPKPTFPPSFRARSIARFPSISLIWFMFLYQGTSLSSLKLIVYGTDFFEKAVGAVTACYCVGVPLAIAVAVRAGVAEGKATYFIAPATEKEHVTASFFGKKTVDLHFWIGPGEWVSVKDRFVRRFLSVLRSYRQERPWGSALEFASMGLLAAANTPETESHRVCGMMRLASAVVCLGFAGVYVAGDFLIKKIDCYLLASRLVWQAAAGFALACGFFYEDAFYFSASTVFVFLAVASLLFKSLVDLVHDGVAIVTHRRSILQKQHRLAYAAPQTFSMPEFDGIEWMELSQERGAQSATATVACNPLLGLTLKEYRQQKRAADGGAAAAAGSGLKGRVFKSFRNMVGFRGKAAHTGGPTGDQDPLAQGIADLTVEDWSDPDMLDNTAVNPDGTLMTRNRAGLGSSASSPTSKLAAVAALSPLSSFSEGTGTKRQGKEPPGFDDDNDDVDDPGEDDEDPANGSSHSTTTTAPVFVGRKRRVSEPATRSRAASIARGYNNNGGDHQQLKKKKSFGQAAYSRLAGLITRQRGGLDDDSNNNNCNSGGKSKRQYRTPPGGRWSPPSLPLGNPGSGPPAGRGLRLPGGKDGGGGGGGSLFDAQRPLRKRQPQGPEKLSWGAASHTHTHTDVDTPRGSVVSGGVVSPRSVVSPTHQLSPRRSPGAPSAPLTPVESSFGKGPPHPPGPPGRLSPNSSAANSFDTAPTRKRNRKRGGSLTLRLDEAGGSTGVNVKPSPGTPQTAFGGGVGGLLSPRAGASYIPLRQRRSSQDPGIHSSPPCGPAAAPGDNPLLRRRVAGTPNGGGAATPVNSNPATRKMGVAPASLLGQRVSAFASAQAPVVAGTTPRQGSLQVGGTGTDAEDNAGGGLWPDSNSFGAMSGEGGGKRPRKDKRRPSKLHTGSAFGDDAEGAGDNSNGLLLDGNSFGAMPVVEGAGGGGGGKRLRKDKRPSKLFFVSAGDDGARRAGLHAARGSVASCASASPVSSAGNEPPVPLSPRSTLNRTPNASPTSPARRRVINFSTPADSSTPQTFVLSPPFLQSMSPHGSEQDG